MGEVYIPGDGKLGNHLLHITIWAGDVGRETID